MSIICIWLAYFFLCFWIKLRHPLCKDIWFALIQNYFNFHKFDCLQIDILNTENPQNGVGKLGLRNLQLKARLQNTANMQTYKSHNQALHRHICVRPGIQSEDQNQFFTFKVRTFWQSEVKISVLALWLCALSSLCHNMGVGGVWT